MKYASLMTPTKTNSHSLHLLSMRLLLRDSGRGLDIVPFLYLGVHSGTGLVAGFGLASPACPQEGIIRALVHCIRPKAQFLADHELSGSWPLCGPFDNVVVPGSEIGELAAGLGVVCEQYGCELRLSRDDELSPMLVRDALYEIPARIESEFCLSRHEICEMDGQLPDILGQVGLHAFRYWPSRGFVEEICSPPEWSRYIQSHALRTMSGAQRLAFTTDLENLPARTAANPS